MNCAGKWGHESIYLTPSPRLPLFWRKVFTILIPCLTRPSCPLSGILFTKTVVDLGYRRFTSWIGRSYCCMTWAGGWASRSLPPIFRTTWEGLMWRGKIVSRRAARIWMFWCRFIWRGTYNNWLIVIISDIWGCLRCLYSIGLLLRRPQRASGVEFDCCRWRAFVLEMPTVQISYSHLRIHSLWICHIVFYLSSLLFLLSSFEHLYCDFSLPCSLQYVFGLP